MTLALFVVLLIASCLRDLRLEYLREMQAIIAQSTPDECVGLFCLYLRDLSTGEDNAFAD